MRSISRRDGCLERLGMFHRLASDAPARSLTQPCQRDSVGRNSRR
jgi:hypothetical protein